MSKRRYSSTNSYYYDSDRTSGIDRNASKMRRLLNKQIRRLTQGIIRLRKDRDSKREEILLLENANNHMNRNFNIEINELKEENAKLNQSLYNMTDEYEQYEKLMSEKLHKKDENFNNFVKQLEVYKNHLKNELSKAVNALETERNKCKHFEIRINVLMKQNNDLTNSLSVEKKNAMDLNKSQIICINQLKNKNKVLINDNKELENKLDLELKNNSETSVLKKTIHSLKTKTNQLKASLDNQIMAYNKLKNDYESEVIEIKAKYNSQIDVQEVNSKVFKELNAKNQNSMAGVVRENIAMQLKISNV